MGLLTGFAALLAAPAVVLAASPPSLPTITSISFSGNGCSSNPKYSGNFNDLQITYNSFSVQYPGSQQTQNCQVHIQASGGTPGWQFSIRDVQVTGHAYLTSGTNLDWFSTVYFSQDAANTGSKRDSYQNDGSGTISQDVVLFNDLSGNRVWSPCLGSDGYTGILNVNWRGALTGDGSKASFDAWYQRWDVDWRRC
ncbi:hypothetical protein QBC47DRAFT_166718 [Echria macrotheca]|uniref:Uncharacterized protein n=1 Tax=Echria macrotheca TaxID=438768 RepID=A0AAJ0FC23_9PEZI|nr:hypothetical protein QBC47DRAFT_166718 [Echria macrotheca]